MSEESTADAKFHTPSVIEELIKNPPMCGVVADPAAGTGALPPPPEGVEPKRKFDRMPRRVAVGTLLEMMARKNVTIDEVEALAEGVASLVRRCRHSARNWTRRRERGDNAEA